KDLLYRPQLHPAWAHSRRGGALTFSPLVVVQVESALTAFPVFVEFRDADLQFGASASSVVRFLSFGKIIEVDFVSSGVGVEVSTIPTIYIVGDAEVFSVRVAALEVVVIVTSTF